MPLPVLNRRGAMPRSGLYLAALLVLALAVLFILRRNPAPPDHTLGGKLFSVTADQIEGMLLTRSGAQYRIDRAANGVWTLSGAVSDYLDQRAVANLLGKLTQATGGRLLAGSEPEDRRYEFNGPGAVRLTVFTSGGGTEQLAIGAVNPVTGSYYGSGAGRQGCFPVASGLRQTLTGTPGNLQLKTLLPAVDRQAVTQIEVWRGDQHDLLSRRDGRWWLQMPTAGPASLGPWYRDYTAHYHDRTMTRNGQTWLLADDRAARLLIYQSSEIIVKEILPPGDAARMQDELGLDLPWRRVRLSGQEINPDPTSGSADQLEIAFGPSPSEGVVPVLRRGNVLLTETEAVATVSEPLSQLLDAGALGFNIGLADSLVLTREGSLLLRAHRDPRPARPDERRKVRPVDFWLTDFPGPQTPGLADRARHARSQNLLVNLDRTSILRVLPPSPKADPLKDNERLLLTLWFAEGSSAAGVGAGKIVLEIGYLDEAQLPAGSADLVNSDDGLAPVGLWRPDTGQLLQIPGHTITTARAWTR